jgi:HAD superfamily hydrolase (TIGR01509 family)
LHRIAYNDAFAHFDVRVDGERVVWTEAFYDDLQNKVGGGKPKMRWYFGQAGWPTTTAGGGKHVSAPPSSDADKEAIVDELQDWKTERYKAIIANGEVDARPGVLRLMDEARAAGLALGVCSAATKSSVIAVLTALLGEGRFKGLDVFLAGDDVAQKKPDPSIYIEAAARLGVDPAACVVVEDSAIGAAAAAGAGMRCVVTYTRSTATQSFPGAERVVAALTHDDGRPAVTVAELVKGRVVQDDRVEMPRGQ